MIPSILLYVLIVGAIAVLYYGTDDNRSTSEIFRLTLGLMLIWPALLVRAAYRGIRDVWRN
jgi:hypothetical protein